MMIIEALEKRYGDLWSVLADRRRAAFWRMRGASIGAKSRVGEGCIIQRPWGLETGERVQFEHAVHLKISDNEGRIRLGDEVFLGFGTELDISLELRVGNHVLIAPGCFITDHTHRHAATDVIARQGCECAPVHIGDDVWLGAHAVILPGVIIGAGAMVGANAVVNRDVEPMSIVAGVPARTIGVRS